VTTVDPRPDAEAADRRPDDAARRDAGPGGPDLRSPEAGQATPARLPTVDDFPEVGPNALATFAQRGIGRVIDALLELLPVIIASAILVLPTLAPDGSYTPQTDDVASHLPMWVLALAVGTAVVYETVAIAWTGRTVGKLIVGTRVAQFTNGKRPTWTQSLLRALLPAVGGAATLALFGMEPLGAFVVLASAWFNPLRRGWHDGAAGSIVVRTR
jgi:uncharacterized RDD family membrane protein YckC